MPTPVPPFDLDLLRSFMAIADSGGFSRAAERIGRTQSTISLQIKRLEAGLGQSLFQCEGGRGGRTVLTPQCEVLLADLNTTSIFAVVIDAVPPASAIHDRIL